MTDGDWPAIRYFGESALLVSLGERIDAQLNSRVHALAAAVGRARAGGDRRLGAPVAGYASLLVPFDPALGDGSDVADWLRRVVDDLPTVAPAADDAPLEVAVRYGGLDGPDLEEVARQLRLSAADVVELHGSVTYRVYMLGFAPGFGYLGELPAALELARRGTPRPRVPAGSVAIAARQTAVYPLSTPGGWHLIGSTDARLWDPLRDQPALLSAGRLVRFVARG